jgi:hypothetical protein
MGDISKRVANTLQPAKKIDNYLRESLSWKIDTESQTNLPILAGQIEKNKHFIARRKKKTLASATSGCIFCTKVLKVNDCPI